MNQKPSPRLGLLLAATAVASLGAATRAAAQAPQDAAEAEGPPLYRVEVIVFAHDTANASEELFTHNAARAARRGTPAPAGAEPEVFDFDALAEARGWPAWPDPNAPIDSLEGGASAAGPSAVAGAGADAEPGADTGAGAEAGVGAGAGAEAGVGAGAGAEAGAGADAGSSAAGELSGPRLPGDTGVTDPAAAAGALAEGEPPAEVHPLGGEPDLASAPFKFRLLKPEELQLTSAYDRLARNDGYMPLAHGGWIQEGLPQNEARPFNLTYLGLANPSGTIRLHVSRFLHLTLDLDYRPDHSLGMTTGADPLEMDQNEQAGFGGGALPQNDAGNGAAPRAGGQGGRGAGPTGFGAPAGSRSPFGSFARPELTELSVGPRFKLSSERRVRRGEVHYFDHPFYGVIVVVEPYEPPAPAQVTSDGLRPAA